MSHEWYVYVIAFIGALIAGSVNTLAGNGSAITLSILTELLGLPGNLANGTNRIGVLLFSKLTFVLSHKAVKVQLPQEGRHTGLVKPSDGFASIIQQREKGG